MIDIQYLKYEIRWLKIRIRRLPEGKTREDFIKKLRIKEQQLEKIEKDL